MTEFRYEMDPKLGFVGALITGMLNFQSDLKVSFSETSLAKIRSEVASAEISEEGLVIKIKSGKLFFKKETILTFLYSGLYRVSFQGKEIPFEEIAKEQKANLAVLIGHGRFYEAFKIITRLLAKKGDE